LLRFGNPDWICKRENSSTSKTSGKEKLKRKESGVEKLNFSHDYGIFYGMN